MTEENVIEFPNPDPKEEAVKGLREANRRLGKVAIDHEDRALYTIVERTTQAICDYHDGIIQTPGKIDRRVLTAFTAFQESIKPCPDCDGENENYSFSPLALLELENAIARQGASYGVADYEAHHEDTPA